MCLHIYRAANASSRQGQLQMTKRFVKTKLDAFAEEPNCQTKSPVESFEQRANKKTNSKRATDQLHEKSGEKQHTEKNVQLKWGLNATKSPSSKKKPSSILEGILHKRSSTSSESNYLQCPVDSFG